MKTLVRLALVLVFALTAAPMAAPNLSGRARRRGTRAAEAELRPGLALDVGQGRQVRLLDGGDAALARVQRSVLVQLRDAGRREVVDRRSGQEDEDAALGQREDGGAAHAHPAHAVRRAASADRHDSFIDNDTKIRFSVIAAARLARRERRRSGTDRRHADRSRTRCRAAADAADAAAAAAAATAGSRAAAAAGAAGGRPPRRRKQWWLEYDVATGTLVAERQVRARDDADPTWAHGLARQADDRLRARPQPLHDGREELRAGEEEGRRPGDSGNAAHDRRRAVLRLRRQQPGRAGPAGRSAAGRRQPRRKADGRARRRAQQSEADKKFGPRTRVGRRLVVAGQQEVLGARAPTPARSATCGSSTRWPIRGRASRPTSTACPARRTSRRSSCTSFDIAAKKGMKISTDAFKDQQMGSRRRRSRTCSARSRRRRRAGSSPTSDKIYFNRTSRDLKRIDIVEADTITGEPRVVVAGAIEHLHRDSSRCAC